MLFKVFNESNTGGIGIGDKEVCVRNNGMKPLGVVFDGDRFTCFWKSKRKEVVEHRYDLDPAFLLCFEECFVHIRVSPSRIDQQDGISRLQLDETSEKYSYWYIPEAQDVLERSVHPMNEWSR